jgi:hypothetical protein
LHIVYLVNIINFTNESSQILQAMPQLYPALGELSRLAMHSL